MGFILFRGSPVEGSCRPGRPGTRSRAWGRRALEAGQADWVLEGEAARGSGSRPRVRRYEEERRAGCHILQLRSLVTAARPEWRRQKSGCRAMGENGGSDCGAMLSGSWVWGRKEGGRARAVGDIVGMDRQVAL